MEEIKIGSCTSCDKQIFDPLKKKGERFSNEYREHILGLSNDSLIRVGVCSTCKEILDGNDQSSKNIADLIVERHKIWWMNNLPEIDRPKFYQDIFVTDVVTDEKSFKKKLSDIEQEKQTTREWQASNNGSQVLDKDGKVIVESFDEYKNRNK